MSKAEELAQKLADMTSKHKAPSHERGVLNGAIEELRRLAALEKAIMDAEPFAEVRLNMTGGNAGLSTRIVQIAEGYYPAGTPLYTLNGIKKP